jgi:hypothetical protein
VIPIRLAKNWTEGEDRAESDHAPVPILFRALSLAVLAETSSIGCTES